MQRGGAAQAAGRHRQRLVGPERQGAVADGNVLDAVAVVGSRETRGVGKGQRMGTGTDSATEREGAHAAQSGVGGHRDRASGGGCRGTGVDERTHASCACARETQGVGYRIAVQIDRATRRHRDQARAVRSIGDAAGGAQARTQNACGHRGATGIGVPGVQGQGVAGVFGDRARSRDQAIEAQIRVLVEQQLRVVDHIARDPACGVQFDGAATDGGATGVGAVAGQRECPGPLFGQARVRARNCTGKGRCARLAQRQAAVVCQADVASPGQAGGGDGDVARAGIGRRQAVAQRDRTPKNRDRPIDRGVRSHRHCGRVARLAQRQARQAVAKVPACGAEGAGKAGACRLDAQRPGARKRLARRVGGIVLQHQRAPVDGGGAAVSVVAGERQRVAGILDQFTRARDRIGHRHVVAAVEAQGGVVGHRTAAQRSAGAAPTDLQHARADGGGAAVGVCPRQGQHARVLFDQ